MLESEQLANRLLTRFHIFNQKDIGPVPRNRTRGNGEGTIRKRRDGAYEGRITLGVDINTGKQIRKSVYAKKRRDCVEKMNQVISEVKKNGNIASAENYTIAEWFDYWIVNFKIPSCSTSTINNLQNIIQNYIKPAFGRIKLNKLSAHVIQQLYSKIDSTKSTRMVEMTRTTLNNSLDQAMRMGLISNNPVRLTVLPKKRVQNTAKALTNEEQKRFAEAIKCSKFENLFSLYLYTGMRRAEALALKWENIDMEKRILFVKNAASIKKNFSTGEKAYGIYSTKTKSSIRQIPIQRKLYEILEEMKKHKTYDLVFHDEKGTLIPLDVPSREFKTIMEKAGLLGFVLHDMRHTFATRCMEAGIPMKLTQSWLGHSTLDTTMSIYTHANSDVFAREIAKLDI